VRGQGEDRFILLGFFANVHVLMAAYDKGEFQANSTVPTW
jgi:hypothetical protein